MPKGDSSRIQNQTDYQTNLSQNYLNNLRNQQITPGYQNAYNTWQNSVGQNVGDYGNQQQAYQQFLNPQMAMPQQQSGNMPSINPQGDLRGQIAQYLTSRGGDPNEADYWVSKWGELNQRGQEIGNPNYASMRLSMADSIPGQQRYGGGNTLSPNSIFQQGLGSAIPGYQEFAQTGGFSPQDIQNMRARAVAPTRGIYEQAKNELARQKNLSGGYMPNYGAAANKLARQESNQISDIDVNTEAALAQLRQQGRLAGLGGLTNIGTTGLQGQLQGLSGMTNLYGTNPGQASTFGNQYLQTGNQLIDLQRLQQGLGQQAMQGQIARGQQPSAWSTFGNAMNGVGQGLYNVGQVARAFA